MAGNLPQSLGDITNDLLNFSMAPKDIIGNFVNLIEHLGTNPNDLKIWINLLVYYVAPFLIVYYILRDFFEEIDLVRRYSSAIAFFISLASFPFTTYAAAIIVSTFSAFSVLFLFGAVFAIGLGRYYRKRLREYRFLLHSRLLTAWLSHLPLIIFFAIMGGVLGYALRGFKPISSITSIVVHSGALLIIGLIAVSMIAKIIIAYLSSNIEERNIGKICWDTLIRYGGFLLPLFIGWIIILFINKNTIILGSLAGIYLSLLLSYLNIKVSNPVERIKSVKEIQEHLFEELNTVQLAICGIDKLITGGKPIEKEWKALEKFGIPKSKDLSGYNTESLQKIKQELEKTRDIIKSKIDVLYNQMIDQIIEEE